MKLQIILWFYLLFFGTEAFARHEYPEEKDNQELNSINDFLSEFSDATSKWISLYQKFQGMEILKCSSPENKILCESFRKEVNRMSDNFDKSPNGLYNETNPVLFSIQEKLEKIDSKIESEVEKNPMTTRDHINAMKSLERRLRHFHMTLLDLEQEMKLPSKHHESKSDHLIDINENEFQRPADNRMYDYDSVYNLTKMCSQLMTSYKSLLQQLKDLNNVLGGSSPSAAYALRIYKSGLYKNSAFKDIKDMLETISDDIKSLKKMSSREMNENEKILKKINKKLEAELKDDDKDDEDLKKSLKSFMVDQRKKLEISIRRTLKDLKNKKDTDDDDDSDDDDDDSDDDSSSKGKRKSKDDTDDDDDDSDDDCSDSDDCEKSKRGKKGREEDDSDEDDDDSDEDNKKGRKKPRNDNSDDTDDNDDSDDDDDDGDDDDDDDSNADGKRNRNRKKSRENLARNKYLAARIGALNDVEMLKNQEKKSQLKNSRMFWKSVFGAPVSGEKSQD